jgi:hypothetical protein
MNSEVRGLFIRLTWVCWPPPKSAQDKRPTLTILPTLTIMISWRVVVKIVERGQQSGAERSGIGIGIGIGLAYTCPARDLPLAKVLSLRLGCRARMRSRNRSPPWWRSRRSCRPFRCCRNPVLILYVRTFTFTLTSPVTLLTCVQTRQQLQ